MQVLVAKDLSAADVQAALQLRPRLVSDLLAGGVDRRLSIGARRVPLRNVDGQNAPRLPVAPFGEIDRVPELPLNWLPAALLTIALLVLLFICTLALGRTTRFH